MSQTVDGSKVLQEPPGQAVEQNVFASHSYFENYPLMIAGIAFAAGVHLSNLVRRQGSLARAVARNARHAASNGNVLCRTEKPT